MFLEKKKFTIFTLFGRVLSCSDLFLFIQRSTIDLAMSDIMCPTINPVDQGAVGELAANRVMIVARSRGH